MAIYGIDVSSYNGKIDWKRVHEAGCGYAVIKITRRDNTPDARFSDNRRGCTEAGILWGVYRYAYEATRQQAERAAKAVIRLLDGAKAPKGTFVWWDMEDESIEPHLQQEREHLRESVLAAQRLVQAAGYRFGIYTGLWWYQSIIRPMEIDCPYWIARYPSRRAIPFGTPPEERYRPQVRGTLWGWQYSSAGQVPGISHSTDLDVIYPLSGGTEYPEPTENLRLGSRGAGVCWVQDMLNRHGADLAVDGIFGRRTDEAVRRFQREHGLSADGIVGRLTRSKLKE